VGGGGSGGGSGGTQNTLYDIHVCQKVSSATDVVYMQIIQNLSFNCLFGMIGFCHIDNFV
jgi:hypothetical protein